MEGISAGKTEKLYETRLVKKEDQADLREIWKLCFGDEDSFLDMYFQAVDWLDGTAVLLLDGRVVSMLTMIPVEMVRENGENCRAVMLYAIATHPDYRKRGCADRLIEFSNRHLLSNGTAVTLLVPAGEELFRFYEKQGYRNCFYVREAVVSRDEIERLAGTNQPAESTGPEGSCRPPECRITPADPAEYNQARRILLKGYPYLDYRTSEISFQKSLGLLFDADLLVIKVNGSEGCFYYERISQAEVMIKELLIPERCLAAALKKISELIPAEKYIIRTPPYAGEFLGGVVRPFGMLRINSPDGKRNDAGSGFDRHGSYLGIAYD